MKKAKRLLSLLLAVTLLATMAVLPATINVAAAGTTGEYNLATNVQDGVILHAWNWSYNNIKAQLPVIAQSGYSTVQTSPVQMPKTYTPKNIDVGGQWWKLYQPVSYSIETNYLGSEDELRSLCTEADKYGIKIIVDIVANHLGTAGKSEGTLDDIVKQYEPQIFNAGITSDYFHQESQNTDDKNIKWQVQGRLSGMQSVNTGNSYIQQSVTDLLKQCIDVGVDGFRFDAAKHIETPYDGQYASDFWPNVLNATTAYAQGKGVTPYYYGEILNTTGNGRSRGFDAYTEFMSITDNVIGRNIRNGVKNHSASAAAQGSYNAGNTPNKYVLWAESHDCYAGDEFNPDGSRNIDYTKDFSISDMVKTWALVGSREHATALYFSRTGESGLMGEIGDPSWKSVPVAEVNKFHNAFIGQSEYVASSGTFAYIERGTSGAVIVNTAASNSGSVNIKANKLADGNYTDMVTGDKFTVSGGQIKGNIGSSGVAVLRQAATTPFVTSSSDSKKFGTSYLKLNFSYNNATYGTFQINNGQKYVITNGNFDYYLGENDKAGTKYKVTLTATDGTKTVTNTYNYEKVEKDGSGVWVVLDNTKFSNGNPKGYDVPNIYVWYHSNGKRTKWDREQEGVNQIINAEWPGEKMTRHDEISYGYYFYELPKGYAEGCHIVFMDNSGKNPPPQYPAAKVPTGPFVEKNQSYILTTNSVFKVYTGKVPTEAPAPEVILVPAKDDEQPTSVETSTTTTPIITTTTPVITTTTPVITTTTPVVTTTAPVINPGSYIIGDANGDNKVTVDDATEIQKHLAKVKSITGTALSAANADEESGVTVADVTLIQKYLAHFEKTGNVGEPAGGSEITTVPDTTPTTVPDTEPEPDPDRKLFYVVDKVAWALDNAADLWVHDNVSGEWYMGFKELPSNDARYAEFILDKNVSNISIYHVMGSYAGGPATGAEVEAALNDTSIVYNKWENISIGSNNAYALTGNSTGELIANYDPNAVEDSIPLKLYFIKPADWQTVYVYGWGGTGLNAQFFECTDEGNGVYSFDFSAYTSAITPGMPMFKLTETIATTDAEWNATKQTDNIAGEKGKNTLTIQQGLKGTWSYVDYGDGPIIVDPPEPPNPPEPDPNAKTFYVADKVGWALDDAKLLWIRDNDTGTWYLGENDSPTDNNSRYASFALGSSVNNISIYNVKGSYDGGPATGAEVEAALGDKTIVYDKWENITIGSNNAYELTGSTSGNLIANYDPDAVEATIPLKLYFVKPSGWESVYIHGWGVSGLPTTATDPFIQCTDEGNGVYSIDFSAYTTSVPAGVDCFKLVDKADWKTTNQTADLAGQAGMNTLTIETGGKGTWSYVDHGDPIIDPPEPPNPPDPNPGDNAFYVYDSTSGSDKTATGKWLFIEGAKLWIYNKATGESFSLTKELEAAGDADNSTYAFLDELPSDWTYIAIYRTGYEVATLVAKDDGGAVGTDYYNMWDNINLQSGANCISITGDTSYDQKVFDPESGTLSDVGGGGDPYYPPNPGSSITIYFENKYNWAPAAIRYWNPDGLIGIIEMTATGKNGSNGAIWSAVIPSEILESATAILFRNNYEEVKETWGNYYQTEDIAVADLYDGIAFYFDSASELQSVNSYTYIPEV
ncbi:MAG: hypothetical protein LBM65_06865 [Oscillospiraceae bacterium]|jgi:alpha-amylase|nr:hypothetical protein [Oscillospiraceae bacterium]